MIKVQMPYGYRSVQVGNIIILTAKIRVKCDIVTVNDFIGYEDRLLGISVYHGKNGTVIISWSTTNVDLHQQFVKKVNCVLAHVMHKRIAVKYGEILEPTVDLEW
jgi:hypothetical protein